MSNNRSGSLWVALGVLFLSILLNLLLAIAVLPKAQTEVSSSSLKKPERLREKVVEPGSGEGRIAMIPIKGVIGMNVGGSARSMVDSVKAQLRQAENDSKVKAVVLAIDSPGGEVTASDILYNAVRRVRAKKPVIVSMGSLAASGGYYIACGGTWLIANETTFTGSIGVIIQTFRYNELLGKIGVAPQTFKSGEFKDMLSGTREMTPAEKEYIQKMVMQTYGKFVGIVARERHLPEDQLRSGIADGRVVSGRDALDAKLVNALGEIEDAYAKARELGKAPDAPVVSYEEPMNFGALFRFFSDSSDSSSGKVELKVGTPFVPLEPGKAYQLPSIYVP